MSFFFFFRKRSYRTASTSRSVAARYSANAAAASSRTIPPSSSGTPPRRRRSTSSVMPPASVRHSKRSEKAGKLIAWGVIVAVFSILSMVMNLVNGGEFNGVNLLTGVAVPALYIYGAVLNSKADDAQPAA